MSNIKNNEDLTIRDAIKIIIEKNNKYKAEAYLFVLSALDYYITKKIKEKRHITGKELSYAVAELAIKEFGVLAKYVLNNWGIYRTEDIGNIVYELIDVKVLSKTESDKIEDFNNVFSFDKVFDEREILKNNIKNVNELNQIKCELKI